jgi:DNA repair protein RadD
VKVCEQCHELCHTSAKVCPECGHEFPPPKPKPLVLHDDDIMGIHGTEMKVTDWIWRVHTSKSSGKDMLAVTYYGALSDQPVTEYFPVTHDGYAGEKARRNIAHLARESGVLDLSEDLDAMAKAMSRGRAPAMVEFKKDGKFYRVIERSFEYD